MARWQAGMLGMAQDDEAPTWALIAIVYGGWLSLTWWWAALPLWVVAPLGAWLCAWHMSLQHELIHGHPTRCEAVNFLLAAPPLNLWLPYGLYRDEHRRHHRDDHLTDPLEDPESTYATPEAWASAGPLRRWLHVACNTVTGRVLLGPLRAAILLWHRQAKLAERGMGWSGALGHALGVCLVLGWVCVVCRIGLLAYVACFVYPGTALIMLRSLAEHRAADRPADRTAVVDQAGLLGLLFLNNNLHALHHAQPSLPWHALPAQWRRLRARQPAAQEGPVYHGYMDVVRRYAVQPHHPGPHPLARGQVHIETKATTDDLQLARESQVVPAAA